MVLLSFNNLEEQACWLPHQGSLLTICSSNKHLVIRKYQRSVLSPKAQGQINFNAKILGPQLVKKDWKFLNMLSHSEFRQRRTLVALESFKGLVKELTVFLLVLEARSKNSKHTTMKWWLPTLPNSKIWLSYTTISFQKSVALKTQCQCHNAVTSRKTPRHFLSGAIAWGKKKTS